MNDMVERVARVLVKLDSRGHGKHALCWDEAHRGLREKFRQDARAVIAAMREPMTTMVNAAIAEAEKQSFPGEYPNAGEMGRTWRAMIEAALQ